MPLGRPDDDRCELLGLKLPAAEQVRDSLPDAEELEAGAARAKALGHPTRLQIACALMQAKEPMCVCDHSWVVGRTESLVSHHVRQLRAAGLAESERVGKMVLYELTPAGVTTLAAVKPQAVR